MKQPKGRIVRVWRDRKGEWRWTAIASNGKKRATSGEGLKNRAHCAREAQLIGWAFRYPVVIESKTK